MIYNNLYIPLFFPELFLENVFQEMSSREVDLSCNNFVSRVVEDCLRKSLAMKLLKHHVRFMEAVATNFRLVCKNQFASHVVQTLIHGIPFVYSQTSEKVVSPSFSFSFDYICKVRSRTFMGKFTICI